MPAETARPAPTPGIRSTDGQPASPDEAAELAVAVEALVLRYTCGSVIDATWAASARLFRPGKTKGAA